MRPRVLKFSILLAILLAAGCGPAEGGAGLTTPDAGASAATVTPTEFQWFPPSETPIVGIAYTPTATPERRPGVGELVIEDPMTSATHWNASVSGEAAVTVSGEGLTVSAQPGQPPVVSLHRSAVFDDMYIEVTARLSLCRDKDAYGLVFRAPNDVAHYRYLAICDGRAAVERMSLGTPRALQPPSASADLPVGAPGEVRLGVWALGSEFRFFLNDHYQFTVQDSNYRAGGIGVFVQAAGETPAVVAFSNLSVRRLTSVESAATATP